MKQHVTDLKHSKMLKEAGWEKETVFVYGKGGDKCEEEFRLLLTEDESWSASEVYESPLATELLEELPGLIKKEGDAFEYYINVLKYSDNHYQVMYVNDIVKDEHDCSSFLMPPINDYSLPNALAECWIYLKKNNLLAKVD